MERTNSIRPIAVNRALLLTGIFMVSMSGLILEVSITRIFSAAIWYHHAFLAVSLAFLGLGSAGLFLQLRSRYLDGRWRSNLAIISSISIAISIPIVLFVMHALSSQVLYLPLFLILSAIPFFFIGLVIATAFNSYAQIAGKLYFADLIGASLGSLVVVGALVMMGGENTMLVVGVVASVAAIIFAYISRSRKMIALGFGILLFSSGILVSNNYLDTFSVPTDPTAQKDLPIFLRENPGTRVVKTEWNSFSRIDVVEGPNPTRLGEGMAAKMFIDGGAGMNILLWDGDIQSRKALSTWMQYLPFSAVDEPKVLVIGSGGGRDVLAALVSGSTDVTAVEINPIIFNVVNEYGERAGNIYKHPNVRAYVDEGRSFVTRTDEKYDIIYIPFVDTWASISSGGLSLSENYIYTIEAFEEYYDHLTEEGMIVVVRWLLDSPRFISTFTKMMEEKGIPQTEVHRHLIAVTSDSVREDPSITMVIFNKQPFTQSQLDFFSHSFATHGYKPIVLPGRVMLEPYDRLFNGSVTLEEFYGMFGHRVHPVTDDDPYFLTFEIPLPPTMMLLIMTSLVILAFFLVVPLVSRSGRRNALPGALYTVPYFAALGAGFMLIEVALLQRLILLLGNPTATLAVLLFTLLLFGGIGSLTSTRIMKNMNMNRNLVLIIIGISVLSLAYAFNMNTIISTFLAESFMARIFVTIAMLAPLGFMMGMPFPTGMRIMKRFYPQKVPWMWAINGAFSVFGAVMATSIGIMYGLSWAIVFGVLAYGIALGIAMMWKKMPLMEVQSVQ